MRKIINWEKLIGDAWDQRASIIDHGETDSFRVFHGYEEGFVGLTIEKFGDCAVVDFKEDIREDLPEISRQLLAKYSFKTIIAKGHQSLNLKQKDRVYPLHGEVRQSMSYAQEFNVKYGILQVAQHNCGLYLDARPVRRWLLNNSKDRKVLNMFSFAGSLGLAAAVGGASSVVHVDKSAELLPRIRQSYEANGVQFDDRCFLKGDVYRHLPRAIKHGQRFDGIILDPPPKVYHSPYAKSRPRGQDFAQLVYLCAQLLNENGWIVALFHRFDSSWDEHEREIVHASRHTLQARTRYTSDLDFPESNPDNKLRVSVFYRD